MSKLQFQWDEHKARTNATKHGITFDDAKSVFLDEHARLIDDPDHSGDEERFVLLGLSSNRSEGNVIRIISARKATSREAKLYP